jgi:hypothetical protein
LSAWSRSGLSSSASSDFYGPWVGEKPDGAADSRHRRGLLGRQAAPSFGESALRSLHAPQAPHSRACPAPDSSIFMSTRPIRC